MGVGRGMGVPWGMPVVDSSAKNGLEPQGLGPLSDHHGTYSLRTTGTGIPPPACVSRRAVAIALDAAVMMPRGSADVRGEQLAALETEHHALLTTPKVARLLERAEAGASQLEDWPLANLREMAGSATMHRDAPSLIARLAKATRGRGVLVEARKANDFKISRRISRKWSRWCVTRRRSSDSRAA